MLFGKNDEAKTTLKRACKSILQGFGMSAAVLIVSEIHNANAHGVAGMLANVTSQNTLGIVFGVWIFFSFIMFIRPKT